MYLMEKLYKNQLGQWTLRKEAAANLKPSPTAGIKEGTYDVEVHPMVDHLKRVKSLISDSGKKSLKVSHLKQAGVHQDVLKHVPRDANGWVTPEAIEEHIGKLPKEKVRVHVFPYQMNSQMHHPDAQEHVVSVNYHPDTLAKMPPDVRKHWEGIKSEQHQLHPNNSHYMFWNGQTALNEEEKKAKEEMPPNQIGWGRVDATSKPGHWHLDEIQSDFNNKDKIKQKINGAKEAAQEAATINYFKEAFKDPKHKLHGDYEEYKKLEKFPYRTKENDRANELWRKLHDAAKEETKNTDHGIPNVKEEDALKHLSHGHDDPQHLIHSAVNALARHHDVNSMSMDTPEDQAQQSGLRRKVTDYQDRHAGDPLQHGYETDRFKSDLNNHINEHVSNEKIQKDMEESKNPYLKAGIGKLDPNIIRELVNTASNQSKDPGATADLVDNIAGYNEDNSPKENQLSGPEKDAVSEYLHNMIEKTPDYQNYDDWGDNENPNDEVDDETQKAPLPVHQVNTYDKRPKKLGYQLKSKDEVMPGTDQGDEEVQYTKVHKADMTNPHHETLLQHGYKHIASAPVNGAIHHTYAKGNHAVGVMAHPKTNRWEWESGTKGKNPTHGGMGDTTLRNHLGGMNKTAPDKLEILEILLKIYKEKLLKC